MEIHSTINPTHLQLGVSQYLISIQSGKVEFYSNNETRDGLILMEASKPWLKIELNEDLYDIEVCSEPDENMNWKKDKIIQNGKCFLNGLILKIISRGNTHLYDLSMQSIIIYSNGISKTFYTKRHF